MSDYVQMWKDLGMDLETHDQLCEVLPTAFGDVYLSQENRPGRHELLQFCQSLRSTASAPPS